MRRYFLVFNVVPTETWKTTLCKFSSHLDIKGKRLGFFNPANNDAASSKQLFEKSIEMRSFFYFSEAVQSIDGDSNTAISKMIDSYTLFWIFTPVHIGTDKFSTSFPVKYWTELQYSKKRCTPPEH